MSRLVESTTNPSIQPAVKCRGQEYLRIIYGPEYSLPQNLELLRQRGLSAKRSLALREFALGIEGLERFVAKAPLRQIHEFETSPGSASLRHATKGAKTGRFLRSLYLACRPSFRKLSG